MLNISNNKMLWQYNDFSKNFSYFKILPNLVLNSIGTKKKLFCDLKFNKIANIVKNIFLIKYINNEILWIQYKNYFYTHIKINFINILRIYNIKSKKRNIFFFKYYYIGLGYKMFTYLNKLFVWVGLTHYTLIPVPNSIQIFSRKKRIYIVGHRSLIKFKNFIVSIRRIKKKDIYKGKGILEVKSYKGFIKMKTGKKKQY